MKITDSARRRSTSSAPAKDFYSQRSAATFYLIGHLSLPILCLLWILIPCGVYGQIVTSTLQGTVQDPSGAMVPKASVKAKNVSTNIVTSAETDTNGRFVFASLPPGGPYTITVEAPGFKTEDRQGINLALNQAADITIVMQVGSNEQKVEVVGDAAQVETTNADMGQVITNRSVVDLPLNQRNVYSLMFLVPGVTGTVTAQYNSLNMSVNGGRPGTTGLLVDGIPASPQLIVPIAGFAVFPSVDAVQEFKVELNGYSAQFGRSGSGITNIILKSGGNQLHGSAYEFLRNSDLDSNTFFSNRNGTPLPSFKRSQFGGSVSGPVDLPKLYHGKDKTFFLFSYEGLRQGTATQLTTTVPTALQRAGDFSKTLNAAGQQVAIYDPTTTTASGSGYVRQPFPGNVIPVNRIDAVAANAIKYYPMPNTAGAANTGQNNYFASGTSVQNVDTFDAKVDENFDNNNRMFARYSRRNLAVPPALLFPSGQDQLAEGVTSQKQVSNSAAVDYTHTFSPRFLTDVAFGFSRTAVLFQPFDEGFSPTTLGFPSYIASNADHLLFPQIAPANYFSLGNSNAQRLGGFNVSTIAVNNSKITGNHVIMFGFEGRVYQSNDVESPASTGNYSFTNAITQGPNPNAATTTGGNSIASLLLGVGSGTMNINTKNGATESKYWGTYIQDNWKASPRLSFNLGLRYDLELPRTERYNHMETFDTAIASPLAQRTGLAGLDGGVVFTGSSGSSRRQFSPQWKNFGPRVGLSYTLDQNTVIRASYGIYYGPSMHSSGNLLGTEGFSSSTTYTGSPNGLTPSVYLSNPFPTGLNLPVGTSQGLLTGIGSSWENPLTGDEKVGYTQNWDFDVQRQLPFGLLLDLAYVGSHGVHLNQSGESDYNVDQLTPSALALGSQLQQSVANPFYGIITTGPEAAATIPRSYLAAPFPQFTAIYLSFLNGGYEEYHSFQLKVNKRVSHGLTLLASFTGQKQIDDYSGIENVGNITGGIQNIYNPGGERAVSSNDISRSLVLSAVYALPFGRGERFGAHWSRPVSALFGGWQVNTIITEHTGFPLAPSTQNTSNSGSNVLRPNMTGTSPVVDGSVESRLTKYLNSAAFSQPAPFTFGNAPRTLSDVRGPSTHNIDLSLYKNFVLIENRVNMQLRAEAFNLLNQVVFSNPNMVLSSGQFGVISGQANTPRDIQFALKILF